MVGYLFSHFKKCKEATAHCVHHLSVITEACDFERRQFCKDFFFFYYENLSLKLFLNWLKNVKNETFSAI